ncbi:MAG: hypothetical protein ACK5UE_04115 [Chitinophagales bacterium]|jgi:L-lactate utilization protein LutB|nr:CCDC90 family protein [Sphingobacteriales bacterium]
MTAQHTISIYEILYPVIKSEAKTKELVASIEKVVDQKFDDNKNLLATKEDIANLRTEMKEMKSEMIKWMFIFWVGQMAVTFGFILLFLKK